MINWIPLSDRKNLDTVKIIFEYPNNQPYGGYYSPETRTIVVVHRENVSSEAAVLAHEYRHHIQYQLNMVYLDRIKPRQDIPYEKMIRNYFRNSRSEYDALLYEYKHSKCDLNDWWLNKLVLPRAVN